MSFPRYPAYKKTDHSWLGEIPSTWSTQKFRHLFNESSEKIEKEVFGDMLSVSGYRGIELKEYDDENRRRRDEDLVGYRIVRRGQLVVNTMWLNYAGLGFSELDGHVSPAYRAYWARTDENTRYLHYLLRSEHYVKGYTRLLTGVRPNSLQMSRDNMMSFPVILPPKEEQLAIATFLDRETAKIDALIAEQQRLIELLQEKRQAVISHAGTKGLNPDAPMKDSGVEWLGEVPEHWEVMDLLKITSLVQTGPFGSQLGVSDYVDEGVAIVNPSNIIAESIDLTKGPFIAKARASDLERHKLLAGDLVIARRGEMGRCAVVDDASTECICGTGSILVRPREWVSSYFLAHIIRSEYARACLSLSSVGSTMENLSAAIVGRLRIPVPPLAEQAQIEGRIFRITLEFQELVGTASYGITLLQERRSALISAAVTGQIDVRRLVPEASAA